MRIKSFYLNTLTPCLPLFLADGAHMFCLPIQIASEFPLPATANTLPPPPQDDAHIFCLPSQIADEIRGVLDLTEELMSTFGFTKFEVRRCHMVLRF